MRELKFLREWVQRLRFLVWFGTHQRSTDMSVAEHSYMTAAITVLLCDQLGLSVQQERDILRSALFHDLEEGFTADVNSLAKRLNGNFAGMWKAVRKAAMEEVIAPPDLVLRSWRQGDHPVVKAADKLSMWLYASEEVDMGNTLMRSVCYVVAVWLQQDSDEWDWLRPWADAVAAENRRRGITASDMADNTEFVLQK
jgi:5'-deoxynucleotidase YfbR-like HD superfamily hydrolase